MTSVGLCFTSAGDVITFHQNWHHQNASFPGRKDLPNDTQNRVIGSAEPEIYMKMLKKLIEKFRAKLPATTRGYSMVKFARVDNAFLEIF